MNVILKNRQKSLCSKGLSFFSRIWVGGTKGWVGVTKCGGGGGIRLEALNRVEANGFEFRIKIVIHIAIGKTILTSSLHVNQTQS